MPDISEKISKITSSGEWIPQDSDANSVKIALRDLRSRLDRDTEKATCEVMLYAKQGRHATDQYRRLRMNRKLAENFKADFLVSLEQLIYRGLEDDEGLRPYGFGDDVENTIIYLPQNAYSATRERLDSFPEDLGCHDFTPSDRFIEKLKSIYISLTFDTPRERLIIGQARGPSRILTRNRLMAILINNEYEHIEAADTLIFSSEIDFIIWRNWIFVNRLESFEASFGIREATKAMAIEAVNTMLEQLPVRIEIAPEVLSRVRISKKLAKMINSDHLNKLTPDKLREHIKLHDLPAKVIQSEDGSWQLVLDQPNNHNDQMLILRLLDDDLYHSFLTENRYAARAKDRR